MYIGRKLCQEPMIPVLFLFTNLILAKGLPTFKLSDVFYQPSDNGIQSESLGGGFQGDMILLRGRGAAIYGNKLRWPQNSIPYDISGISDENDRKAIIFAMHKLMYAVGTPESEPSVRSTCVYFRPRQPSDQSFLVIKYGTGCSATIGYHAGFELTMTLNKNGCFFVGTIQHELLHVLGFWHEQSRPDRDDYVTINLENIIPEKLLDFQKYSWDVSAYNQGYPYDYSSIMHYGSMQFSKNGKPTITPKRKDVIIGLREKLSEQDIAEVRDLYKCSS